MIVQRRVKQVEQAWSVLCALVSSRFPEERTPTRSLTDIPEAYGTPIYQSDCPFPCSYKRGLLIWMHGHPFDKAVLMLGGRTHREISDLWPSHWSSQSLLNLFLLLLHNMCVTLRSNTPHTCAWPNRVPWFWQACEPSNYAKVNKKPKCPVSGCKERLNLVNTHICKHCSLRVCLKHRYADDHNCPWREHKGAKLDFHFLHGRRAFTESIVFIKTIIPYWKPPFWTILEFLIQDLWLEACFWSLS